VRKYLKGGCKANGARLFSVVTSTLEVTARGNKHKQKHRKFNLKIRIPFFIVKMLKY